jgi:carbon storage regulator CsrA
VCAGQSVVIDGNIRVTVDRIGRRVVRLKVDAPTEIRVDREEVWNRRASEIPSDRAGQIEGNSRPGLVARRAIEIESQPGEGICVIVELPPSQETAANRPATGVKPPAQIRFLRGNEWPSASRKNRLPTPAAAGRTDGYSWS